jgi:hypothetical protein
MIFEEFLGIVIFGLPFLIFIFLCPIWLFFEIMIRRIKNQI